MGNAFIKQESHQSPNFGPTNSRPLFIPQALEQMSPGLLRYEAGHGPYFKIVTSKGVVQVTYWKGTGTGFLMKISPGYNQPDIFGLITSKHVLPGLTPANLQQVEFSSDVFKLRWNAQKLTGGEPNNIIGLDKEGVDAIFFRMTHDFFQRYHPYIEFLEFDARKNIKEIADVAIFHYPGNDVQKVSTGSILKVLNGSYSGFLVHNVPTDNGSSGAPLVSKDGDVVGIYLGTIEDIDLARSLTNRNDIKFVNCACRIDYIIEVFTEHHDMQSEVLSCENVNSSNCMLHGQFVNLLK